MQGEDWDALGGPMSFPVLLNASSQPALRQWACAQPLCPVGLAEFQVGFQALAYGPGNSSSKTKLLSTVALFLVLHGGARA